VRHTGKALGAALATAALAVLPLAVLPLTALPLRALAAQPSQPPTWNFQQADVPGAQPLGNYGKGVLVAVVDTWIDFNDSQFAGRVVDVADCAPGSCQDHTYAPDSCVHGTHVAGTVASAGYGVAPQADILAVQGLSGPAGPPNPSAVCSGSANAVAAGIDFAVAKGAEVINLSLADQVPLLFQAADSTITNAVANAHSHGVVVVLAAGNNNAPLSDNYGQNALVVAATGPSGSIASYSNSGPFVTIAAPGGDAANTCTATDCVLSTFPSNGLGLLQGTSQAAPHVAGLAALLLAQDPRRGVSNVFSTIESTASPLAGGGSGLIDAKKALAVEAASHPFPSPATVSASRPSSKGAITPAPVGQATAPGHVTYSGNPGASSPVPVVRGISPAGATPPSTSTPGATLPTVARSPVGAPAARPSAAAPPAQGLLRATPSSWFGRHAAILAIACLLVAGDIVVLLRKRLTRSTSA
jgi:subtilisin family serine protease